MAKRTEFVLLDMTHRGGRRILPPEAQAIFDGKVKGQRVWLSKIVDVPRD